MKHEKIIITILFCGTLFFSFAKGYIVVDPGHGGPGADQYHNGGNGSGAVGQNGTAEQWVNLNVAYAIRDTLLARGCVENEDFMLSRLYDTNNKSLPYRAGKYFLLYNTKDRQGRF